MGERLKRWLWIGAFLGMTGCAPTPPPPADPVFSPGGPQEKAAIVLTEKEARSRGYHPEKMKLVVRADADAGNFMVFLFPLDPKDKTLDKSQALYALVNARTGQLIRFSDPKVDLKKKGQF